MKLISHSFPCPIAHMHWQAFLLLPHWASRSQNFSSSFKMFFRGCVFFWATQAQILTSVLKDWLGLHCHQEAKESSWSQSIASQQWSEALSFDLRMTCDVSEGIKQQWRGDKGTSARGKHNLVCAHMCARTQRVCAARCQQFLRQSSFHDAGPMVDGGFHDLV